MPLLRGAGRLRGQRWWRARSHGHRSIPGADGDLCPGGRHSSPKPAEQERRTRNRTDEERRTRTPCRGSRTRPRSDGKGRPHRSPARPPSPPPAPPPPPPAPAAGPPAGRGSHHPGAEADNGGEPRAGVDVPPVEAVLHVGVRRLGVQAPLLRGGLAQEADGEERGDEGRVGRQVEEELLPEGGQPVVCLRGGGGRPGVGGSAGAPPAPPEVDIGGEGLTELIHSGRSHDLVLAELLQQLSCGRTEADAAE